MLRPRQPTPRLITALRDARAESVELRELHGHPAVFLVATAPELRVRAGALRKHVSALAAYTRESVGGVCLEPDFVNAVERLVADLPDLHELFA